MKHQPQAVTEEMSRALYEEFATTPEDLFDQAFISRLARDFDLAPVSIANQRRWFLELKEKGDVQAFILGASRQEAMQKVPMAESRPIVKVKAPQKKSHSDRKQMWLRLEMAAAIFAFNQNKQSNDEAYQSSVKELADKISNSSGDAQAKAIIALANLHRKHDGPSCAEERLRSILPHSSKDLLGSKMTLWQICRQLGVNPEMCLEEIVKRNLASFLTDEDHAKAKEEDEFMEEEARIEQQRADAADRALPIHLRQGQH